MEILDYAQLTIHTDRGERNAEAWLKEYYGHFFIEVREPYRSYLVSDDEYHDFSDASAAFRQWALVNKRREVAA